MGVFAFATSVVKTDENSKALSRCSLCGVLGRRG
jgi:hypothetical protein